jgi:NADH-quinone oxidoreductase subunit L
MLMLVLGSNVLVMFVGWEGVGLCSYLLIGFYYVKKSASDAANKAFIVNRIGDFAFILGALLMFKTFGSLDFTTVALAVKAMPVETTFLTLSTISLLFFIGATGKSAQIPLYVWLPDAMEGPTPVSALIHAATMVTAGVYMIGRNAVLFEHAPLTMTIVAVIGASTALFAGTIGLVQNDIKRVLAYSTVSQLGYMFLAMGVGAFGAGIFHLYTHAFFKALLFLGSGAVIHALHGEQDIRNMGGLKKHIPLTYWTFIIGAVAIAGVPFLSGFFSKDEILYETFHHGHQMLWVVGVLTSLLTATYMFRLVHLTFHGEERFGRAADSHQPHPPHPPHLHDAPAPMAFALVVLALGSILAGYVGVPHALGGHNPLGAWLEPAFQATNCGAPVTTGALAGLAVEPCLPGEEAEAAEDVGLELSLMVVSSLIAFAGIGLATFLWLKRRDIPAQLAQQYAGVHRLLLNKYYVDEVYDATIVQPIKVVSEEGLWRGFDVKVVDGAVNGAGYLVSGVSIVLRLMQNGSVKTYAASTFMGAVAILAYYLWR